MNLYKVLIDKPSVYGEGLHLFVKFIYAKNDDWHEMNRVVCDVFGMGHMVIGITKATEDEEIAYLNGHEDGIDKGWNDRLDFAEKTWPLIDR